MRFATASLILVLLCGACRAQEPELFRNDAFDAAMIARAANYYVAMGETGAREELMRIAREYQRPDPLRHNYLSSRPTIASMPGIFGKRDNAQRVAWMCLILWPARKGEAQRSPGYGVPMGLEYFPEKSWPLFPVVAWGQSFFVFTDSYIIGGMPEMPVAYLQECMSKGTFRTSPVTVPTHDQAEHDLLDLKQSPLWKTTVDVLAMSGSSLEGTTWRFLWAQAAGTP